MVSAGWVDVCVLGWLVGGVVTGGGAVVVRAVGAVVGTVVTVVGAVVVGVVAVLARLVVVLDRDVVPAALTGAADDVRVGAFAGATSPPTFPADVVRVDGAGPEVPVVVPGPAGRPSDPPVGPATGATCSAITMGFGAFATTRSAITAAPAISTVAPAAASTAGRSGSGRGGRCLPR
jgi:hypothetical protein